ncbi:cation:proton antiporter [bacterium]|nr:cation:proton antiporter [bacterium]
MDNPYLFLENLALVLAVAGLTTIICHKLKQPVVLGYIIAGMLVGPHVPIPLVADSRVIHTLSELGVILIMFSIGLELSITKVIKLAPTTGFVGLIESSFMMWLGYAAGRLFGLTGTESLYTAAIVAISSTTIIAKVFEEKNIRGKISDLVFGVLIFEDVIAILLLAVLNTFSAGFSINPLDLMRAGLSLAHFLVFTLVVGVWLLPRLMRVIVGFNRSEITLVTSIGICFLMALLAHKLGYSVALGAFLAGALIAESGEGKKVEHMVRPVRDMFGAVFFVAVGMLFNPVLVMKHWQMISVFVLIVIVGKFVGVSMGSFLSGFSFSTSIRAGMSMTQIGEFSFILAAMGLFTGATRDFLYPVAIAVSCITALTTPLLIKASVPFVHFIDKIMPASFHTFLSLYGSWIHEFQITDNLPGINSRIKRLIGLCVLDVIILAGFIIGVSYYFHALTALIVPYFPLSLVWVKGLVLFLCVVLGFPFVLGIIRCAGSLGVAMSSKILPVAKEGSMDKAATPRKAFVVSIQMVILAIAAMPFLALTQPFVPLSFSLSLFGMSFFVIAVIFWRNVGNLQGHVKAGAQVVIEALSSRLPSNMSLQSPQLSNLLPGLGVLESVIVTRQSPAFDKTLSTLNLRALTGATVVAITRKTGSVVMPSGNELLQEGDILTLTGPQEVVDMARSLLLKDKA